MRGAGGGERRRAAADALLRVRPRQLQPRAPALTLTLTTRAWARARAGTSGAAVGRVQGRAQASGKMQKPARGVTESGLRLQPACRQEAACSAAVSRTSSPSPNWMPRPAVKCNVDLSICHKFFTIKALLCSKRFRRGHIVLKYSPRQVQSRRTSRRIWKEHLPAGRLR